MCIALPNKLNNRYVPDWYIAVFLFCSNFAYVFYILIENISVWGGAGGTPCPNTKHRLV